MAMTFGMGLRGYCYQMAQRGYPRRLPRRRRRRCRQMTMMNQTMNLVMSTMAVAMTMFSTSMTKILKGHYFHVWEDEEEEEEVAADWSTKETN